MKSSLLVRHLNLQPYQPVWEAMKHFVDKQATAEHPIQDELWLLEHAPVYTLGQNGSMEHVLCPGDIPVIPVDRGGQVTYHGPGQLVAYFMINIKRKQLGVRQLVSLIEQSMINALATWDIRAQTKEGAPGVYVNQAKIGSLGLRIRKGCSYHGLSLNVNMDMEPFARINPCGYKQLAMTQCSDLGGPRSIDDVKPVLIENIAQALNYSNVINIENVGNNHVNHNP